MLSHFSGILFFATLWIIVCQASLSMGFSRQEYWSVLPFLSWGDLPDPGSKPRSPALTGSQDWSPLGWTGWIYLQSKGLSRVFSNTTVQKQLWVSTAIKVGSRQTAAGKASVFLPQHPAKLPSLAYLFLSWVQFLTPICHSPFLKAPSHLTPHLGNIKAEQVQAQHYSIPVLIIIICS